MRAWIREFSVVLSVVLLPPGGTATAQCTGTESAKLIASDGSQGDGFGVDVSLSGNVALMGAYRDQPWGVDSGSAYVFRFDGVQWVEEQKIVASDGMNFAYYGACVSLSGNVAVVGAPFQSGKGQAYVYRFDGSQWVEEQKLVPSDLVAGDQFGCLVSISGNVALVGSPGDDPSGVYNAGSAYVFRFDGTQWLEEQKLTASDGADSDLFGMVSVAGDVAVIGAWKADTSRGKEAGAAYVFRFTGSQWVEEQKLTASGGGFRDQFGLRLSTDGDIAVIAARREDTPAGTSAGAVYVYRFDGSQWVEEQVLASNDSAAGDVFGADVSMDGDAIVSSADDDRVYLFRFDGARWVQQQLLKASDGTGFDGFGTVSIASGRALVGALNATTPGGGLAGAAYVFSVTEMTLSTNLTSVVPGDTLSFTTCGGLSGAPVGLFLVDANGTPVFLALGISSFDALGTWVMSSTVPSGLSGLVAGFLSLGFVQPSRVGLSGVSTVTFQ